MSIIILKKEMSQAKEFLPFVVIGIAAAGVGFNFIRNGVIGHRNHTVCGTRDVLSKEPYRMVSHSMLNSKVADPANLKMNK